MLVPDAICNYKQCYRDVGAEPTMYVDAPLEVLVLRNLGDNNRTRQVWLSLRPFSIMLTAYVLTDGAREYVNTS